MITVITGGNDFARKTELHSLIKDYIKTQGDLGLERLDGDSIELGYLLDVVASLPFLSDRRMIVLDEPSHNKTLAENIEKVIENTADTTDLIILEPKPDKRSTYYKTLTKKTSVVTCGEMDARQLASWLSEQARHKGGHLSQADAYYLVERVGGGQLGLSHELDKLLTFSPKISRDNIDLLTEPTPQSTIFELLDAAFAGKPELALKIYHEQRALKVEPQQIIAMIAWQLHILALIKTAGGKTPESIARETKLNPYVVAKSARISGNLTMAQLQSLVERTLKLDVRLKSESIDADEALQNLLISL